MIEASSSLDRYRAAVERLLTRHEQLTDVQVRAVRALLVQARKDVLNGLAALAPSSATSYQAHRLSELRTAIDRAATDLGRGYAGVVTAALDAAWRNGLAAPHDALPAHVADELPNPLQVGVRPEVSRLHAVVLQAAQQAAADVGDVFRQQLGRVITHGVLGQTAPHAVMQQVRALLATQPSLAGKPSGLIDRLGELYLRNEMMGVYNVANAMAHNAIAAAVPGVKKWWASARDDRVRPDHAAADARYRPGGSEGPIPQTSPFRVGDESARFPHDPALSSAQRYGCRCVSVVYKADWFAS